MKLIEAKQFEYAIQFFEEINDRCHDPLQSSAKIPKYRILWKFKDQLFFCETFKRRGQAPIIYESNSDPDAPSKIAIFSESEGGVFKSVRSKIYHSYDPTSKEINDTMSRKHLIYKNPEKLLNTLLETMEFSKTTNEKLECSTIYNVSKPFSDNSFKFLKVPDDFELEPVSLIEK